ncbi:uncharacterized protein LOC8086117 [Sorghum bicolor]|uniref:Uncharacterized protein n=1 Tax=Sorghum bicolor TaxID=4558 RepID=C5YSJ5_SORBI|nr:uncharacterized protein LOC8086117 [Sorghum bicolor]EES16418.1 hypothetical protein SORBI_3008G181300 [Sorghum bicolor]|eukprot:XP_002442580.1 uncharacterized protein LOC8086117 [Sorghum bicolor]
MPTSPLKRTSGGSGGRLRRLLASLRPPARAGPLPVQTGFPTSLADIVVKNHGRLRNSRRRHRAPGAAVPPAAELQQRSNLSVSHHDAAAPAPVPVTTRPGKGAGFSIRPGLLVAGGAVALALLVIWSKQLVAAATLASVALSWIESARTVHVRRPETEEGVDWSRGSVSPIRDAAVSPRPSCGECASYDGGSDAAWLCFPDADSGDDSSSAVNNQKRKQSRRSLRKLLSSKLRNVKTPRATDSRSRHGGDAGEHEHPSGGEANVEPAAAAAAASAGAPARETMPAPPPEAITYDDRCCRRRRGRALPLPALVPIILVGLVAGKLPALALAVLCAAFSSRSVERIPVPVPASGDPIPKVAAGS